MTQKSNPVKRATETPSPKKVLRAGDSESPVELLPVGANDLSSEAEEVLEVQAPFSADRKEFEAILKFGQNPRLAQIILDGNLIIRYTSPAALSLFTDYYRIQSKPFFNVFRQPLGTAELRILIMSLKSPERGFSWSGTLVHKNPNMRTLLTRTVINPFFAANRSILGYLVHFEDVTDKYNTRLRTTFSSILEAAKLKDNDTGKHNERVSYYSKRIAEYLHGKQLYPQIDPDFIDNIEFLSMMHDVGKIGTPDYILQKPGKLTELEWDIMREHTINGTFILSSYPNPMAKEIALSHHEWWNGGGYPFRLEGDMIPLSARIVTVADVYDALRMKRTYKLEYTHEEAIDRILAASGTQFDPSIVRVLSEIHESFNEIWNSFRDSDASEPYNADIPLDYDV